jgi:hypothetical protein
MLPASRQPGIGDAHGTAIEGEQAGDLGNAFQLVAGSGGAEIVQA